MNNVISIFLAIYENQGQKMRHKGRYDGSEEGVVLVCQWAGVSALFMPWDVFQELASAGAFKVERMSPAASPDGEEWFHLRPNKKALKMGLAQHQGEFTEVKLQDCTSKVWKQEHLEWIPAGASKYHYNLGYFAEAMLHEHFGLEWVMNRNRRTKGVADMVLTDSEGKRHHWEIKDLVGAGFQIRPERAHELGLDNLCD